MKNTNIKYLTLRLTEFDNGRRKVIANYLYYLPIQLFKPQIQNK